MSTRELVRRKTLESRSSRSAGEVDTFGGDTSNTIRRIGQDTYNYVHLVSAINKQTVI